MGEFDKVEQVSITAPSSPTIVPINLENTAVQSPPIDSAVETEGNKPKCLSRQNLQMRINGMIQRFRAVTGTSPLSSPSSKKPYQNMGTSNPVTHLFSGVKKIDDGEKSTEELDNITEKRFQEMIQVLKQNRIQEPSHYKLKMSVGVNEDSLGTISIRVPKMNEMKEPQEKNRANENENSNGEESLDPRKNARVVTPTRQFDDEWIESFGSSGYDSSLDPSLSPSMRGSIDSASFLLPKSSFPFIDEQIHKDQNQKLQDEQIFDEDFMEICRTEIAPRLKSKKNLVNETAVSSDLLPITPKKIFSTPKSKKKLGLYLLPPPSSARRRSPSKSYSLPSINTPVATVTNNQSTQKDQVLPIFSSSIADVEEPNVKKLSFFHRKDALVKKDSLKHHCEMNGMKEWNELVEDETQNHDEKENDEECGEFDDEFVNDDSPLLPIVYVHYNNENDMDDDLELNQSPLLKYDSITQKNQEMKSINRNESTKGMAEMDLKKVNDGVDALLTFFEKHEMPKKTSPVIKTFVKKLDSNSSAKKDPEIDFFLSEVHDYVELIFENYESITCLGITHVKGSLSSPIHIATAKMSARKLKSALDHISQAFEVSNFDHVNKNCNDSQDDLLPEIDSDGFPISPTNKVIKSMKFEENLEVSSYTSSKSNRFHDSVGISKLSPSSSGAYIENIKRPEDVPLKKRTSISLIWFQNAEEGDQKNVPPPTIRPRKNFRDMKRSPILPKRLDAFFGENSSDTFETRKPFSPHQGSNNQTDIDSPRLKTPLGKIESVEEAALKRMDLLRDKIMEKIHQYEHHDDKKKKEEEESYQSEAWTCPITKDPFLSSFSPLAYNSPIPLSSKWKNVEAKLDFVEEEMMRQIDRIRHSIVDASLCNLTS